MRRIFLILVLSALTLFGQNNNQIKITDPWIRNADKGMNTGMFLKIENLTNKDDELIGVESDFAEVNEIHEVFKNNEMMGMRKIEKLPIKAKSKVELKPRDYHIMFIKLTKDLKLGDKKEVKLKFKNAGTIKVNAVVKAMPQMKK